MSYCTRQNLIDRFGEPELIQLTDRNGLGIIDDAVLDQAIADADAEIDGWIAGRYALPLATVPPALVRVACDITRYRLYDQAVPDTIKMRYDDVVRFLTKLGEGKITLGLDNTQAEITQPQSPMMESGGSAFGRDNSY